MSGAKILRKICVKFWTLKIALITSLLRTFLKWFQFVTVWNCQYKKKKASIYAGFHCVGVAGFEPATPCSQSRCYFPFISLNIKIIYLFILVLRKISVKFWEN